MNSNEKNSTPKKLIRILTAFVTVLVIFVSAYVGLYVLSVTQNPDYITLGVGQTYTLTPTESDYMIRSYNSDVIAPKSGNTLIAAAKGDSVVCVKYTYFRRDFYRFIVNEAPKDITLDKSSLTLGAGEKVTINASCPQGGFDFSFSSSDEDVATVDQKGNVTTKDIGKCYIFAKTYNGISEKCAVEVINAPTSISLSEKEISLGKGEKATIDTIFPEDEFSSEIKYTSSDESVAVMLNNNELNATGIGKCTITATTHNGISDTCEVTVKKAPEKVKLVCLDKCDIDAPLHLYVDMEKNCATRNIDISVSDESVLKKDDENPFILHPVSKGKAVVTVTLPNSVKDEKTITVSDYKSHSISDFKALNQFPSLITGCEVVSLTSVLNHYGFDVDMETMAYDYMPIMKYNYYTVNPNDYFYGVPTSYDDGMGCYPGCIVKTADNYFSDIKNDDYVALNITGYDVENVFNYIKSDVPVITWVTSGFSYPDVDGIWEVDGETITWYKREHCLVTTGYNEKTSSVTVADVAGGYSYSVPLSRYTEVFETMGGMAVAILKK